MPEESVTFVNMKINRSNILLLLLIIGEIIAILLFGMMVVRQKRENSQLRQEAREMENEIREFQNELQSEKPEAEDVMETNAKDQISPETQNSESEQAVEGLQEGKSVKAPEEEGRAEELLNRMTVEEKTAQLFYITPDALCGVSGATRAGDTLKQSYEQYPVGGLIFFGNNIVSESQIREMTSGLRETGINRIGVSPFLGIDEEGGTVTRIAGKEGFPVEDVGDMYLIGETGDAGKAREAGSTLGAYLSGYGFDMDFAPDADVLVNPGNTVVSRRSFGADPLVVSEMVAEEIRGLQAQGVWGVLKHFPGHGATEEDSHEGFAYSDRTLEELRQCEFLPFRAGIEAGARVVMVGHISLPQITGDGTPAVLSEAVMNQMLRQELGFQGIIITDALNMGAITENYTTEDAAVQAILAGADMLLMPADFQKAYQAVLNAVNDGRITRERLDESVLRVLKVKCSEDL